MRIAFVLTLLLVSTLCFAAPKAGGSVKIALPGKKVLTVSQQCLENAVDVCGSPSEDQKYFERFTRTADQVEQINQKNAGWIAGHNKFSTVSDDDIDLRSGSYLLEERGIKNTAPVVSSRTNTGRKLHATLPESFDARLKWPKCVSVSQLDYV
jgi:Tfp pilus assembly major pilin PilA